METAAIVEERRNEFQLNHTSNYSVGLQNHGILILDTMHGRRVEFASRTEMTLDKQPECCDY